MQHQVAKTISEWEWLRPELFIAERPRQLANSAGKFFVARFEARDHCVLKIRHFLFLLLCRRTQRRFLLVALGFDFFAELCVAFFFTSAFIMAISFDTEPIFSRF